jgi:hypothetical protein
MEYSSTRKASLPDIFISALLVASDGEDDSYESESGNNGNVKTDEEDKSVRSESGTGKVAVSSNKSTEHRGGQCNSSILAVADQTRGFGVDDRSMLAEHRPEGVDDKILPADPSTDENKDDFFCRIHSELKKISAERRSLNTGQPFTSSIQGVSPPYLHTAHRSEERLKNNHLRFLNAADLQILLDPMDLPVFDKNYGAQDGSCTPSSTKPVSKKKEDRLAEKTKVIPAKIEKEDKKCSSRKQQVKSGLKTSAPLKNPPPTSTQNKPLVNSAISLGKKSTSLQCTLIGNESCNELAAIQEQHPKISMDSKSVASGESSSRTPLPVQLSSQESIYKVIKVSKRKGSAM